MILTDQEVRTMRALLEYPDPIGLHPNEARWRELGRHLLKELKEAKNPTDLGFPFHPGDPAE
jgi:hypothetical protein